MATRKRWPSPEALLAASPSETQPFLLELGRRQAGRRRPAELMRQWERDSFVAPSAPDQRVFHALDGLALEAASDFEAVQLSPVAPLGVCSALAPTAQDRTLTAQRGTEVVSDPTNVLALECARRLRVEPTSRVKLCTAHQTLRAQTVPDEPGYAQHFRLFVMVQAGKGLPDDGFEAQAFAEHLSVFDSMFDAAEVLGCRFDDRQARILAAPGCETLGERVTEALERSLPGVPRVTETSKSGYYDGLRVLFGARSPKTGDFVPLADTGRFDWVARLTSNAKNRYVASGIGIQLFDSAFRPA